MIRVICVRYKTGLCTWFSQPVDQKFVNVELARDYYKNYYSVEKILLNYEEC